MHICVYQLLIIFGQFQAEIGRPRFSKQEIAYFSEIQ